MIIELRNKFLNKWRGKKGGIDSARAKADIKNHASVIGLPIDLPEEWLDKLLLLIIPPDPLHVVLIGKFYKSSFTLLSSSSNFFFVSIGILVFY